MKMIIAVMLAVVCAGCTVTMVAVNSPVNDATTVWRSAASAGGNECQTRNGIEGGGTIPVQ